MRKFHNRIIQTDLIKDSKGLPDLLLAVGVLHLPRHHRQELREVNGPVALWRQLKCGECVYLLKFKLIFPHFKELHPTISVHLVDHVLEFSFGWVLAQ